MRAAVVLDVDGVLVRGGSAVPHAAEAVARIGLPVLIATNNASRLPVEVAEMLAGVGIACAPDQIITSAEVAAAEVATRTPGASCLVVGAPALVAAVRDAGLGLADDPRRADVVLQGYGRGVRASDLAAAAIAVRHGAEWVATNSDPTIPSELGPVPGNGALVDAVGAAVGRRPRVTGKPSPEYYRAALRRLGSPRPETVVAVGDRLATDVRGANAAGLVSVLVRTGIDAGAVAEPGAMDRRDRPAAVIDDLRGLARLLS